MKKTILSIFSFVLALQMAFGGGIVTNTNQSATWVRSMVRDASVDVDAVFFNPAGLTRMEDGFYIQVNSQTVLQTRTVESTFPTLNDGLYEGSTFVPALPTFFAAYKKGKLAVSAGFTVIGGGGSAEFDRGLPEFEQLISTLPTALAGLTEIDPGLAVTGYSADINFQGSSAYYGIQAGVSYKINDVISVGIGGRYIMANNSYTGHIKDISLMMANGPILATDYINTLALPAIGGALAQVNGGLDQLNTAVTTITPYSELLKGILATTPAVSGLPVDQFITLALATGQLDQATADQILAFMTGYGIDPSTTTMGTVDGTLDAYLNDFNTQISELTVTQATLNGQSAALGAQATQLGDQLVDVTQEGRGFTPIVSVDLSFMEGDLGVALKYEHKTNMKVTTKVTQDDTGLYIDGEEVTAEMPGMFSVGIRYNATDKFRLQTGVHYYLDLDASYGKKDDAGNFVKNGEEATIGGVSTTYLAGNSYEAAIGLEYDLHKMFSLSGGVLYTASNPNDVYQSGLSYSLNTMTFGVGFALHLLENLDFELGYSNTTYTAYTKSLTDANFGSYEETYDKTASVFAAGVTYRF